MDTEYYITYDLGVPYRNITICPVIVKDFFLFSMYSTCLSLDKNSIPDAKIISMTELEYIYYLTRQNPDKTPYLLMFDRILSLCLKDDKTFEDPAESMKRYGYDDKGKPVFIIGDEKYTSKDFSNIKSIICKQNLVELPDENISKEVRDSLEEAERYKHKLSGNKNASFEDYIISLSAVTGWSFEYIYGITARKFIKSLRRYDLFLHYQIFLTGALFGTVEIKDKSFIKHWLNAIDEDDKYKDVSIDLSDVQNKISMESAKK